MKQREYTVHLKGLSLADLKQEATKLEGQLQKQAFDLSLSRTKQTHLIRLYRRQLAACLTIAHQKLRESME